MLREREGGRKRGNPPGANWVPSQWPFPVWHHWGTLRRFQEEPGSSVSAGYPALSVVFESWKSCACARAFPGPHLVEKLICLKPHSRLRGLTWQTVKICIQVYDTRVCFELAESQPLDFWRGRAFRPYSLVIDCSLGKGVVGREGRLWFWRSGCNRCRCWQDVPSRSTDQSSWCLSVGVAGSQNYFHAARSAFRPGVDRVTPASV